MAVSEQRVLPPEFIEAAGKTYLEDLSKATGQFKTADLSKTFGPQFVAGPSALQTQAEGLAGVLDLLHLSYKQQQRKLEMLQHKLG